MRNEVKKRMRIREYFIRILTMILLIGNSIVSAQYLDRIVAVVEEDIILDSELQYEVMTIKERILEGNMVMPPDFIVRKQVLERLIIDKLQRQLAARSGIRVDDEMLNASMTDIASRNGLTLEDFRVQLENQGLSYKDFSENVKNEIIINQLRSHEIGERIKVTDREVEHYLEAEGNTDVENIQYHLGHILIGIPEGASSDVIQKARIKADQVVIALQEGKDFRQTAIRISDGGHALKGGDLGWRTKGQLPTLFVDVVGDMSEGSISEPIRSPSGFHIIKILELKGAEDRHVVTSTNARHILIKTNELTDDEEARRRLLSLKQRIENGDDFEALAKSHSDDKGSALKGGNLDWVTPGALVPPFEATMNQLAIGEISDPVQTQFGWHMIQVLGRRDKDNSEDYKKNKVREEIRKRKIEEETELWLRRLRDEAYVDIRMNNI